MQGCVGGWCAALHRWRAHVHALAAIPVPPRPPCSPPPQALAAVIFSPPESPTTSSAPPTPLFGRQLGQAEGTTVSPALAAVAVPASTTASPALMAALLASGAGANPGGSASALPGNTAANPAAMAGSTPVQFTGTVAPLAAAPIPALRQLPFSIQTNSSVQWFKGKYQHPNTYMQVRTGGGSAQGAAVTRPCARDAIALAQLTCLPLERSKLPLSLRCCSCRCKWRWSGRLSGTSHATHPLRKLTQRVCCRGAGAAGHAAGRAGLQERCLNAHCSPPPLLSCSCRSTPAPLLPPSSALTLPPAHPPPPPRPPLRSWEVSMAAFPHPTSKSPSLIGQFAPTFLFASIMFQARPRVGWAGAVGSRA